MIKHELVKRSPLRILEQSIHGRLGQGNIGVFAAPKGVGKTACLVHLATDQLLNEKHVIHVSFATDTRHIITWYEDIFQEIARRYRLDNAMDVHDEIIRNRVVLNFRQDGVSMQQVQRSLRSMIKDGGIRADVVFVDGYDFSKSSVQELSDFKRFAGEAGLELWFSVSVPKNAAAGDKQGVPALLNPYLALIDILIALEPCRDYIHLKLVKDHDVFPEADLHLKLDPHILLIAAEE
jgi:hypothetical protein